MSCLDRRWPVGAASGLGAAEAKARGRGKLGDRVYGVQYAVDQPRVHSGSHASGLRLYVYEV